jgi:hypothetical protein
MTAIDDPDVVPTIRGDEGATVLGPDTSLLESRTRGAADRLGEPAQLEVPVRRRA